MIPYGSNGKMKGAWIVTELITRRLIGVPEDGLAYDGRKHSVTRLEFSETVRDFADIRAVFSECAEQFLHFFSYLEQDVSLRLPAGTVPSGIFGRTEEDFTGGCFTGLFAAGLLKLTENDNGMTLISENTAFEPYLEALGRRIVSFSGDDDDAVQIGISVAYEDAESDREAEETDEGGADDTLAVSYAAEPADRQMAYLCGLSAEEIDRLVGTTETDDRIGHIRSNVRSTLCTLKQMMDDIDDEGSAKRSGLEHYTPGFEEHRLLKKEGYTVRIPDEFTLTENTDGCEFILWLPNIDNPDEWEASLFSLCPEGKTAERQSEARICLEKAEGNAAYYVWLNTESGSFRFRISTPADEKEIVRIAEELFTEEESNV